MGTLRSESHLSALIVPFPDLQDYETANDGTTNNSSYTESTPRPGLPVAAEELSTLVPVISGAQDGDLVLTVCKGGTPGIRNESLQLGYRYASDTIFLHVRGWSAPNGFDDWDDAVWWTGGTTTSDYFDAVTHPDDQRVLLGHGDATAGTTSIKRWRPDTAAWSSGTTIAGASSTATAMCVLSTGRVLCLAYGGPMSRSDDFGATWTDHSESDQPQLDHPRMVEVDGEVLLAGFSPGTTTLEQWASSNSGATFTQVETIAAFGSRPSLCKLPDGRIVIVYRRNADGFPCSRIIGSPWDPISGASVAVIKSASIIDVVATADDDGILWAYATLTAAAHTMYAFRSQNLGESWGEFTFGAALVSTSATDSLRPLKAVSTQGQVMVICKFVASTGTNDPSIVSLRFGGWSNAPYRAPSSSSSSAMLDRVGFGPHATLTPILYLPIETPGNNGWTPTGAGTESLVSGRCNIVTAANTRYFSWGPGTGLTLLVRAGLKVVSGGMVTQRDIGLTVAVANGVAEYRLDIRFTTTGFRVFDPHASGGAGATVIDVTYDCTAEFDIMVYVTSATLGAYVLYKRPYESLWIHATTSFSLTNDSGSPAAAGSVDWGHIASGTAESEWRFVGSCETGDTSWPDEINVSRPVSTIPVPLHSETESSGIVGRISAIGGSGARGETFEVDAQYDYPAEAIYPQVSPSPSAKWRTTSKTEQKRAWLLDDAQTLGEPHPCIVALGCNFRTAYLEYESSGWNIIATLDLAQGFAGINYSRTGNVLTAGAGGVAPGRFIAKNELAGGYAVIETAAGTSTVARRILGNEAGWWSSSASTKQVRVYLEDVAGTEDASGQCDLVWPSGIAINYQTALVTATRWRIRIPASQTTPDDYYEAGILVPGALHVPGAPPDWGYSEETTPHVTSRTTPAGVSYVRELGLPTRKLSFGWASSGVDLTELRRSATDGDYLGIASQLPFAAREDVPWWAEAMQVLMRSGEIPAVWIKSLPSADTTVTDPSLFTYGRLTSSVGYDHELGDEDTGEVVRPIAWTIEGIR